MSARLKPYPQYRDSGVDWLGRMPAHWTVERAKASFQEVDERSVAGDEELLSVSHKTGVTPRRLKNITMFKAESYAGYKLCQPGDLVVNTMWAWMAALGVSQHEGIVSNAYGVYRPRENVEMDGRYYDYLMRTEVYRAEYVRRSTGITTSRLRLYPSKLLAMPLIQPPPDEQRRIADYLDAYAAQVQRLVGAKRQVKRLLSDRRQAIIRELVFRGIRSPERFIDSGIQWFGEAPVEWDKVHIGSVADTIPGHPFDSKMFGAEQGVPVIRIRDLLKGHASLTVGGDIPSSSWIHDGDLLVGMDGDFNSVIWHGGDAVLNQRLCCIRPQKRISTDFLALILPFALGFINDLTFSTTVKHLSMFDIRRLRFPAPCLAEQAEIVAAAAERTKDLDFALSRVDTEIALILEYRDAMIASAVTGCIDVRRAEVAMIEGPELSDLRSDDEDMEDALEEVD